MTSTFVNIPEETDPDVIAQDIFEFLETKAPNWIPRDTELDTWMISSVARILATLKDTASEARVAIFRYLGSAIYNLPPLEAAKASANTTWKMTDTLGHTIPAGTQIGVPTAGGALEPFETTEDVIIPTGSSETALGAVAVQAIEPGSAASNLGGSGVVCVLEDQYPWVAEKGITLVAATGGGQDEEDDITYLNRLIVEIRLWAPRPITPQNFADMALNIAGVGRALAVNLYNAETKTFGNEKTVTLALEDGAGKAVASTIKEAVKAYLQSKREVNFKIFVIDPSFNSIDVEFECVRWEGFEPAAIRALAINAINEFLQPQTWGLPPFGDKRAWYSRSEVKINDIIAILGTVQGLKDVISVKIRKHGVGAYESKDLVLEGVAALAQPGTIAGTVT